MDDDGDDNGLGSWVLRTTYERHCACALRLACLVPSYWSAVKETGGRTCGRPRRGAVPGWTWRSLACACRYLGLDAAPPTIGGIPIGGGVVGISKKIISLNRRGSRDTMRVTFLLL